MNEIRKSMISKQLLVIFKNNCKNHKRKSKHLQRRKHPYKNKWRNSRWKRIRYRNTKDLLRNYCSCKNSSWTTKRDYKLLKMKRMRRLKISIIGSKKRKLSSLDTKRSCKNSNRKLMGLNNKYRIWQLRIKIWKTM